VEEGYTDPEEREAMDEVFRAVEGVYNPDEFIFGVGEAGFFQDEARFGEEAVAAFLQEGFGGAVYVRYGVPGCFVFSLMARKTLRLGAEIGAYFSEEVFQRPTRNHHAVHSSSAKVHTPKAPHSPKIAYRLWDMLRGTSA
jgi:hypothetical protein